jgi:hypothetical protein
MTFRHARRTLSIAALIIWVLPDYTIAKAAAQVDMFLGALVADLRPLSLLVLFAMSLARARAEPRERNQDLRSAKAFATSANV